MSQVTISKPADLGHSQEVRETAKSFFLDAGLSHQWASRLVLVVDELFMNAVKYGSGEDDTVTLTFTMDEGAVTVEVADANARGIEPNELLAKIRANEEELCTLATSGRGLALITREWTDSFHVTKTESGGLAITFHKTIA